MYEIILDLKNYSSNCTTNIEFLKFPDGKTFFLQNLGLSLFVQISQICY